MDCRMNCKWLTSYLLALLTFGCIDTSRAILAAAESQRNIVFILADDLGYMDIGANNPATFYETPNIDRIAARGMRFTQSYAACPVCSPTRASILTGKYPQRTGITDYIGGNRRGKLLPAPNADHLRLQEVTIAERLCDAGYATFFAGKWHLGQGEFTPNAQGFGPGLVGTAQFYYPPRGEAIDKKVDPKTSNQIADEAVKFIGQHADQPFFAYLPFLAPHIPIGAKPELVEKYTAKRAKAPAEKWDREGSRPVRLVQNHAGMAAMVEQMDSAIGRVIDALELHGLAEKTIVVFTSDNGGLSTAEGSPTSNVPLRAGKGWLYEGGIRVPLIITAPGVTELGGTCATPVISTDFYPTLLRLARFTVTGEGSIDGVDLGALLRGEKLDRGPLYWHYPHYSNQGCEPSGAVRDGDWKLIEQYESGRAELYNLREDPSETTDLAQRHPEKVKKLAAKLAAWRKDVGAIMPTPNPKFAEQQ
jgi:arylsulfatase A-like enzyme